MLWEMYFRLINAAQLVRNMRGTLEAIRVNVEPTGLLRVLITCTERDLDELVGVLDDGAAPFMLSFGIEREVKL